MKNIRALSAVFLTILLSMACLNQAVARNFTIQMSDFSFTPSALTIGVGDTVTWTNTVSDAQHTTTSGDVLCNPSNLWNSAEVGIHGTYSVTFTNYAAGTYHYICTNHCKMFGMEANLTITNNAVSTPPSISLTNPTNGTKFTAPSDVPLQASVVPGSGTVTNVQFRSGAVAIANLTTAPYNFTVLNLAAGNYSFSATAMDSLGAGATSSVANVFVLTNATLLSPRFSNGLFQLTVEGIAGQTYITEGSSNLINWSGVSTNVAPAPTFDVTDPSNSLQQFYRARQDLF